MGEVELSSALAPLSRCRIASPLAAVPSLPRRRILATLSACRRAEYVASSSLGILRAKQHHTPCHEHVDHEHDMHGSMAGRSRADLRWQAHPSQAKGASARAPSNFVPAFVLAIESACRSGSGGRARSTTRTALRTRFETRKDRRCHAKGLEKDQTRPSALPTGTAAGPRTPRGRCNE